jgi:uncharacterized protein YqfA (UPF0365 family)
MANIHEPFGPRVAVSVTPAVAASPGVPIVGQYTEVTLNAALTANQNFLALVGTEVRKGAILEIVYTSDTTARVVTPTTGFIASTPALAGVISKQVRARYVFNGTAFELLAGQVAST